MSCCQIALNRLGIKPSVYYASEVDKHAIKVTMANWPQTIQLGDVRNVDVSQLGKIDLLAGGSPCQSFSFAGKRKGMSTKDNIEILTLEHYLDLKAQNFEFEGQSYLFWEYMRILKDIQKTNPDVKFLLENVIMGDKWQKILTRAIGINPIRINASLVSAQNRDRLFWTNIAAEPDGLFGDMKCTIPQPKDRGILLKDVLEAEVDDKYYLSGKMLDWLDKHALKRGVDVKKLDGNQKSGCITSTAQVKQNLTTDYICVASRGRNPENPTSREPGLPTEQQLEARGDGKTNCLTSVQKDNLIIHNMMPRSSKSGKGGTGHLTRDDGKTYCLDTGNTNAVEKNQTIRRLTPIECERLQCVDDNYTNHVSDTQRYRMLGNGWNCEVIAHIFSHLQV
jgi:DNA (cytosine-5)-methyltransferase 3A